MDLLKNLMSEIQPSGANTSSTPPAVPLLPSRSPKPTQRPAPSPNGTPQAPSLKRKASGLIEGVQTKIQRSNTPAQPSQPNGGAARTVAPPGGLKSTDSASTTSIPYRGTAGLGISRPASAPLKKLGTPVNASAVIPKAAAPVATPTMPKAAPLSSKSTASGPAKQVRGYMAMLMKAKEKDQTKPPAPPIKYEPTKIMTKKDRERARLEAKAAAKGKKPIVGAPPKVVNAKAEVGKEKRKPVELGYQGTARPAPKKPTDIEYKGTARGTTASAPAAKPGPAATKTKSKTSQGRYGGYASWSDEELEGDEDDAYDSDASSDMEGGLWDVDNEEQSALRAAKAEDAAALAEENDLKRQKEERKRKLMALNKAAAAKRKY